MVKKIIQFLIISFLVYQSAHAFDNNINLNELGSPTMQMTFPDLSTAHTWVQASENNEEKRVIIIFYERHLNATKSSLGDDGVELQIIDLQCSTVPKQKVKYDRNREWISYWACHDLS